MSDLNDLYQEVILDHNRRPRNFRVLDQPSHHAEGYNPLCGDRLNLYLKVDGGVMTDVAFQGTGAPFRGVGVADDRRGQRASRRRSPCAFRALSPDGDDRAGPPVEDLGKLSVLAGVREFPVRVKCASLAWHTLKAALDREAAASTE